MIWLYLLAVAVIGVVVVILVGKWDGAAAPREENPANATAVDYLLEQTRHSGLTPEHLMTVKFDSAARGYRMDQVDALLDALIEQLGQARGIGQPSQHPTGFYTRNPPEGQHHESRST